MMKAMVEEMEAEEREDKAIAERKAAEKLKAE